MSHQMRLIRIIVELYIYYVLWCHVSNYFDDDFSVLNGVAVTAPDPVKGFTIQFK